MVVGFSPASGSGLNSALGSDKLGIKVPVYTKGPGLGTSGEMKGLGQKWLLETPLHSDYTHSHTHKPPLPWTPNPIHPLPRHSSSPPVRS